MSAEVKPIAKIIDGNKVITVTSDGLAKDSEGTIVATGVIVKDGEVVASDGTVLWNSEETEIIVNN